MHKNTIELNGKRYDAITGALLGESTAKVAAAPRPKARSANRVIDGFIRPTLPAAKPAAQAAPATRTTAAAPKTAPKVAAAKKVQRAAVKPAEPKILPQPQPAVTQAAAKPAPVAAVRTVHHVQAHQPQHATTLMGRVAQKPTFTPKPAIKPQAAAELVARPPSGMIAAKHTVATVDPDRLLRAQHTPKHTAVSRFPKAVAEAQHHLSEQSHVPVIPVRQAPLAAHATHHANHSKPDIFEAAIARATSHLEPPHRLRRSAKRKLVNALAGGSALLVIGGFITFLNIPNIQLHVASIQAGFHASIPGYAPVGYAMAGGVQRTGDTVSMKFRSGENSYTLTQQPSNWDNETLLENTMPLQNGHQTIQIGGRTVYVYDDTNAVWVTGNVRYDLIGNAPLSANDISHLAMSL